MSKSVSILLTKDTKDLWLKMALEGVFDQRELEY